MAEEKFMENPLVVWVGTFRRGDPVPLKYSDLYDGVYLNDVMQMIDTRRRPQTVNRRVDDVNVRLFNWDMLVKSIQDYYENVLQQLILVKPPNIQAICREPHRETSFAEVERALLMMLGCAVQCDNKEEFITPVINMEESLQAAIMDYTKTIMDEGAVVAVHEVEKGSYTEKLQQLLKQVVDERNSLADVNSELTQERDYFQAQSEGKPPPLPQSTPPDKHHLAVELAECKSKLRHTRQDLEEKQDRMLELEEELTDAKNALAKVKNENQELVQEARQTRCLQDEIDILKEKAAKVDFYETEITKYKERLNNLEFYKTRMEELQEENDLLIQTRTMLEEQLESSRRRVETVKELESQLASYREQLKEAKERSKEDQEKLAILMAENARLHYDKKTSMNETASLEMELEATKSRLSGVGGSLSEQLNETSNARILRLELENQRLQQQLKEATEQALVENAKANVELEKENQRLELKVKKQLEEVSAASSKCLAMEQHVSEFKTERDRLKKSLETVKENAERQVNELEQEKEHLTQTIEAMRQRSEKSNDGRLRDLERDNRQLNETVATKNTQLSKLEFEMRQLQRQAQKSQDSSERVVELEEQVAELEKVRTDLQSRVDTLSITCERLEILEQECSDFEVENRKLNKTIESLQNLLKRKEEMEEELVTLRLENQKLQKMLQTTRAELDKVEELEREKEEMNHELQQTKKAAELTNQQRAKHEHLQFEVVDLHNENSKLQKSLDSITRRMEQLEHDNTDLEAESEKLQEALSEARLSSRKLEDMEKENKDLEGEVSKLNREKATVDRENKKLKQMLESKEAALDDLGSQVKVLEKENKSQTQTLQRLQESASRVRELEKENKEVLQEASADKKTLATLREDLVNEKIRSQQLSNELEKLTQELEHIGINRQHLAMAQQASDESRYKALESMMEEAFSKTLEIKDEKIHSLESRLEESRNRNLKLQEEVRDIRREAESLRQRYEEELHSTTHQELLQSAPNHRGRNQMMPQSNPTREILELKDHLIQVERTNATLMAESEAHRGQLASQQQLLTKMDSKNCKLEDSLSSLQTSNAQLQVENTTLASQYRSAVGQISGLQDQLSAMEADGERQRAQREQLQGAHEALIADHESLQSLHEQLNSEYEALISEHGSLKSLHKNLKTENRSLQEQLDSLLQGKHDLNKLRELLDREREQLKMEQKSLGNLQMDYNRLRDEHDRLRNSYDKLSGDYHGALVDHKAVKNELNALQQQHSELQGQHAEDKEIVTRMEMELQKLGGQHESLYQAYHKVTEENQALLVQMQSLLNQNQELLTQALTSKDHFQVEEKAYLEKLAELRRQKERLEEKIMEHYKNRIESPKKNKGFGAMLVRKARGIISRGRSRSRPNLAVDSPDNSSLGSGSHGDSTEHVNDKDGRKDRRANLQRRGSDGNAIESPRHSNLAKSRNMAKSTTALNFYDSQSPRGSGLRGAKSTEDLANENAAGQGPEPSGNGTVLLPGLGRPCRFSDDDGGFKAEGQPSSGSPSHEMLTLEQFLKEANRTPPAKRKPASDTDSRSSATSDTGIGGKTGSLRSTSSQSSSQLQQQAGPQASLPDVATTSHPDLSSSRLSQASLGPSELSSNPGLQTSTPKQSLPEERPHFFTFQQRPGDRSSGSDSGAQYAVIGRPHVGLSHQAGGSERSPPPPPLSSRSSRELPPPPLPPTGDRDPLERLERLTHGPSLNDPRASNMDLSGSHDGRAERRLSGMDRSAFSSPSAASGGHLSTSAFQSPSSAPQPAWSTAPLDSARSHVDGRLPSQTESRFQPNPEQQPGLYDARSHPAPQADSRPRLRPDSRSYSVGDTRLHPQADPRHRSHTEQPHTHGDSRGQQNPGQAQPLSARGAPSGAGPSPQRPLVGVHPHTQGAGGQATTEDRPQMRSFRPSPSPQTRSTGALLTRPASVMGHPTLHASSSSQGRSDGPIYAAPERARPAENRQRAPGSATPRQLPYGQQNGPQPEMRGPHGGAPERPKSVPPHLFNAPPQSGPGDRREAPMPLPRRNRDGSQMGVHDPASPTSPDGPLPSARERGMYSSRDPHPQGGWDGVYPGNRNSGYQSNRDSGHLTDRDGGRQSSREAGPPSSRDGGNYGGRDQGYPPSREWEGQSSQRGPPQGGVPSGRLSVSLLREPGSSVGGRSGPPGPQVPHPAPYPGPQGGLGVPPPNRQTPTARIPPQTKPSNVKPPTPRAMKPEEQQQQQQGQAQAPRGPKENSIWYEYGCV